LLVLLLSSFGTISLFEMNFVRTDFKNSVSLMCLMTMREKTQ
jgi:hypothetical protein